MTTENEQTGQEEAKKIELEKVEEKDLKSTCEKIAGNKHPKYEQTFGDWASNNGLSMGSDAKSYRAYIAKYNKWLDAEAENKKENDGQGDKKENKGSEKTEERDKTLTVSEKPQENAEENTNTDWIEKKRETWKSWCEDEDIHNPQYIYDEQKSDEAEAKPRSLKFDVYKTPEDKEAGKVAASIEYTSPRKVSIETEEGKVPDYEFFAKLTKDAKEQDKVPGVTFKGEMTPEFQARLAAACLENDMNMVNGPKNIDVNLLGNVSEALKKKVETYNKKNNYALIYEQLTEKAKEIKTNNPDKPVKLNERIEEGDSMETIGLMYAAYANAGLKVEGLDEIPQLKASHGAIQTPELKYFPEEARQSVVDLNYGARKKQIQNIKQDLQDKANSGDTKAQEKQKEREGVAQARDNIRASRTEGKAVSEADRRVLEARKAFLRNQGNSH